MYMKYSFIIIVKYDNIKEYFIRREFMIDSAILLKDIKDNLNVEELNPNASLEDLGLDSLDVVEYLLSLESRFNIEFTSEEMQSLKTLGDLINLIEKK